MLKGIIYFIQPAELVGTNRYKIGCSKNANLDRCKKGYKKETRFICIMECNDPFNLEKKIKDKFKSNFKLFCGNEYFCGDEKNMLKEFIEITYLHKESIKLLDNFNILNVNVEQNKCDILISKENNTQFKCNICNKDYKSYQSLWNHNKIKHHELCLKISNKECKFKCDLCNKKFTRNDNLKYHKNNTCKIINKVF